MSLFFVAYFRKLFLRKQHGNIVTGEYFQWFGFFSTCFYKSAHLKSEHFWSIFTSGMIVTAKRRRGGGMSQWQNAECCVHSLSVVRMDVCSVRRAPLSFEVTLETAWAAAIWAGRGVSVTEWGGGRNHVSGGGRAMSQSASAPLMGFSCF